MKAITCADCHELYDIRDQDPNCPHYIRTSTSDVVGQVPSSELLTIRPAPRPPREVDCEKEIKQLVDAMRYKLKKNNHKGKWEEMTLIKAIELLKEEVKELEEAASRDSDIEIILEAADVSNFAMIVANLAMKRGANV